MTHTVHITEIIDAPIEKIWEIMRDFNGLPVYHPIIKASRIEGHDSAEDIGCIRYLTLEEGFVREKLLLLDDSAFTFQYSIIESSLPLENYVATVKLKANLANNKTICEWWADFNVVGANHEEIVNLVGLQVFKAGFLAVASKLANPVTC